MSVAPETSGSAPLIAGDTSGSAPRQSAQRFLDGLAFLVVLVALWQPVYWKSEVAITGPVETVETAVALLASQHFWRHALASGSDRCSGAVAAPMLTALVPVPKVTLYPMVLLVFGLGISAKVAFGVMHGIIPVIIFTMDAVRNINPVLIKTARILKLSPAQT